MFDDWTINTWTGFALIGIIPVAIMWIQNIFVIPLYYKILMTVCLPVIAWFFIERGK